VSGLLDGLPIFTTEVKYPDAEWPKQWGVIAGVQPRHVREALLSDGTRRNLAAHLCTHQGVGKACRDCMDIADEALRFLAGDDQ